MRENDRNYARRSNSRALVGWLAFLVLLSPLSHCLANGQTSSTISILMNAVVQQLPAAGTNDPQPPREEVPVESVPTESLPVEPAPSEPAPDEPPAPSEPAPDEPATVEPAPAVEPGSVGNATVQTNNAEASDAQTSSAQASSAQASSAQASTANQENSAATASAADAEVTAFPQEGSTTPSASQQPTPPLEQPLSVGPVKSLIPEDRPNWITLEPDYSTDIHRFVVSSIPTAHESDTDANLDAPLEEALNNYAVEQFCDFHAGRLLANRLTAAFIRANLVDDSKSYTAELSTSSGSMFQKWVMVEVTAEQREQLQTWYREQLQRERILPLGFGVAGLLSVVGLLNLVFRRAANKATLQSLKLAEVDQVAAKPSCYSKKFKWGFAIAIAVAVAAAILAD